MAAPQAPPSLGFSRQEHWSGLPFPSPMHESEVVQLCQTLSDPMDQVPLSMGFSRQEYWSGLPLPSATPDWVGIKIFLCYLEKLSTVWLFYLLKTFSIKNYNSLNIIEQKTSFKYCSCDGIISLHALLAKIVCWLSYKTCCCCEKICTEGSIYWYLD